MCADLNCEEVGKEKERRLEKRTEYSAVGSVKRAVFNMPVSVFRPPPELSVCIVFGSVSSSHIIIVVCI